MKQIKIFVFACVALMMFASSAVADDVVAIGETNYETLQSAIDDAKGSSDITIKLLTDITSEATITIPESANISLDLNS